MDCLCATLFCVTNIVIFYVLKVPAPREDALAIYALISSSCANLLGFIAAALTLVAGYMEDIVKRFQKSQIELLVSEFYRAFWSTIGCFLVCLLAMIYPHKPAAVMVTWIFVFFFLNLSRTMILLFKLNNNYIKKLLDNLPEENSVLAEIPSASDVSTPSEESQKLLEDLAICEPDTPLGN